MSLHFPKHRSWSCIKIPNFFILLCARKFKSPAFLTCYQRREKAAEIWLLTIILPCPFLFVCLFPQIYERTSLLTQWIPLELIDTLKMCLSTNEEPWTERVVNQIYIAVAGYNETINRKKCTCINNLKYQEHHNKYTKISWEEKYDNADDQCLGPPRAGIYPRPSRPRPRPTPPTSNSYMQGLCG